MFTFGKIWTAYHLVMDQMVPLFFYKDSLGIK